jgi:hypothetical protein
MFNNKYNAPCNPLKFSRFIIRRCRLCCEFSYVEEPVDTLAKTRSLSLLFTPRTGFKTYDTTNERQRI